MADVVAGQSKPVVVQTIFPGSDTSVLLRSAGIPVHRDVDRAAAVLAGLVERPVALADLTLPAPAPPVTDTSYDAARGLFADAGVPFGAAVTVRDAGRAGGCVRCGRG